MNELKVFKHIKGMLDSSAPGTLLYNKVSTDSRNIRTGDVFFALRGENFDGNDFALEAEHKGASLLVVDNKETYAKISSHKILVKDSFESLKHLGMKKLETYRGTVICITGSSGKTTTKKIISSILSVKYKVFEAYKNYNNELGVSINASNLDTESDFGVFEIGSNGIGEIASLSGYLRPDISIVTNIGSSHIGHFGSIEKIAEEKLSIITNTDKICYLHQDCRNYLGNDGRQPKKLFFGDRENSDIKIRNITRDDRLSFTVDYNGRHKFYLDHFYDHFATDAAVAASVAIDCKMTPSEIQKGLDAFTPEQHRGEIIKINNLIIIDDTYNASFDSIISAIKNLSQLKSVKKYAVLGEMGEIDGFESELYTKITGLASEVNSVTFIFFGNSYKKYNTASAGEVFINESEFKKRISQIKTGTVLFKASRGKKFEKYVEFLKEETLAL